MPTCPCSPDKEFDACCGPYHAGLRVAETAELLMRSRYSAYVLEDWEYLLRTWHPDSRPAREELANEVGIRWTGLEILRTEAGQPGDREGVVEFVARYKTPQGASSLREASSFLFEKDEWFYLDGEILASDPVRVEKIGRNEPCPCGSGKKHKKCCLGKE